MTNICRLVIVHIVIHIQNIKDWTEMPGMLYMPEVTIEQIC